MLIEHLRKASIVMAKSDVHFYLSGVMIDGANIVATDGHQAVHCITGEPQTNEVIIPKAIVLDFLKRSKGDLVFELKDNTLISESVSITFKPIYAVFPSYKIAFTNKDFQSGSIDKILFNSKYLGNIAKIFRGQIVSFDFVSQNEVCRISANINECSYYIMPCRENVMANKFQPKQVLNHDA